MEEGKTNKEGISHSFLACYSAFLFNYPGIIIVVISIVTTVLPATVLFFNPLKIDQNPETVSHFFNFILFFF